MGTCHRQQVTLQQHITAICVCFQNLCFCVVETQYDEGPRDWQKLFAMRRFCFHTGHLIGCGKKAEIVQYFQGRLCDKIGL